MLFFFAASLLSLFQATSSAQAGQPAQPTVSSAHPQTSQSANPSTPTDPKELLEAGRKANGLRGSDIRPWHLKANYEAFEDDGKTRDKGSFEEWWVSEKQVKTSYATEQITFMEYVTDQGTFRVGDRSRRTGAEFAVQNMLTSSTIDVWPESESTIESKDGKIGSLALRCLVVGDMQPQIKDKHLHEKAMFCFDSTRPILRFTLAGDSLVEQQAVRDKIVAFQNRYLARTITVTRNGKKYLSINLESIELLDRIDEASLKPPPEAVRVYADSGPLTSDGTVIPPKVLHAVNPVYPLNAREHLTQGLVTVQVLVGADGNPSELVALDGPPVLRPAALEALRHYIFKPATQGGKSVPCLVNIVVNFQIY